MLESIAGALDAWYLIEHNKVKLTKPEWDNLVAKHNLTHNEIKQEAVYKIDEDYVAIDITILEKNNGNNYQTLLVDLVEQRLSNNLTIKQNGLGYNNILSMAALMGDLQKKPAGDEFSVFLVEEPEAHLHPQLLDLLFFFFQKSNADSKVQIFMTSHSPTLVSNAEIDSLNILYQLEDEIKSSSLAECNLEDDKKDDLKRYLDVTKHSYFLLNAFCLWKV